MAPPSQNDGSDRDIHRLFDGDLSASEIEALIESEKKRDARGISGIRAKLEALGDLRAVIRAATSDESDPIDADAAWAQIAARIAGAASDETDTRTSSPKIAAQRPALRVIEGGLSEKAQARDEAERPIERAQERAQERAESAPPGLLQRVDRAAADRDEETKRRERQVRQRRSIIMVVSGLAAAAAAAIVFFGPGDGGTETIATTSPPSTTTTAALVEDPPIDEQLNRTEVIAVDFGSNVGTVFSVEGSEGSRYAVVWLADEVDKTADPEETEEAPAPDGDDTAEL